MKKPIFTTLLVLGVICFAFAQKEKSSVFYANYQLALSADTANYFHIQNKFNAYWNSLNRAEQTKNARELRLYNRWDWFWGPRMQGTDGIMSKFSAEYLKTIDRSFAHTKSRDKLITSITPCPKWNPIGPDSIKGVGPNNNNSGNRGVGRITSVAFHRQFNGNYGYGAKPASFEPEANTLFACSNTGGVFKSKNGGKNWSNLNTDKLIYTGVRDFEISDYNDNEYYFISSFGGDALNNGSHGTTAIYRTDNGGQTWKMGGSPFNTINSGYNPYNKHIVNDLEVIPSGTSAFNEYILVASQEGVYRSSDKAVSFNKTITPPFTANFSEGPMKIIATPSSSRLYLSGEINWKDGMSKGYDADTIFRSTNKGASWDVWKKINIHGCTPNGLSLGIPDLVDQNVYVKNHSVHVSPKDQNKIWVFIQVISDHTSDYFLQCIGGKKIVANSNNYQTLSYLFLSKDGGNTWSKLIDAEIRSDKYDINGDYLIHPFSIEVNPLDDTKLYQYVSLGGTEGLLHSKDEGATWSEVNPSNYHYDSRTLKLKTISSNTGLKVYGLAGHDGGLNLNDDITQDFNKTNAWDNITGRGLQVAQIYRHSSSRTSKKGRLIVFGAIDIGHSVRTGFQTNSWEQQGWASGDGMGCAFDFVDSTKFYIADGQFASLKRGIKVGANKTDFTTLSVGAGEGTFWVAPLILNPQNSKVLVSGYKNIYKSKGLIQQGGIAQYNKLTNEILTGEKLITQLAIAPSDSNVIFGTLKDPDHSSGDYKRVFKSIDNGVTWNWSGNWWVNFVSDIAIHPKYSNVILATSSGVQSWSTNNKKVRISIDQGVSWHDWGQGLVDIPVNAIVINSNGTQAFVGTDRGVYYRGLSSSEWTKYGCGLPNTIVSDLDLSEKAGKLRASTYGRGMWEVCTENCSTGPGTPDEKEKDIGIGLMTPNEGESKESLNNVIQVAPNPNNGLFKVLFTPSEEDGKGELIIKNMDGLILYSSRFDYTQKVQHIFKIDLAKQPSGVYYVEIRTKTRSNTTKVIKL